MKPKLRQHMINPTAYADVNEILNELLANAQVILGESFVGMYLDGSLASGDFDYETSDIDIVVATAVPVSGAQYEQLAELHGRIRQLDTKWANELEGAYIPLAALRRYDPDNATHPYIDRGGALRWEHMAVDWVIHRHVLVTSGITLAGPPVQTLIDPVSPAELRQATGDLLDVWWVPMCTDPTNLEHEGYRGYAILTMCRMLVTFATGGVVSKPSAAWWAQENLESRWQPLINWAQARPSGAPVDNLWETQAFILYTCEQRDKRIEEDQK